MVGYKPNSDSLQGKLYLVQQSTGCPPTGGAVADIHVTPVNPKTNSHSLTKTRQFFSCSFRPNNYKSSQAE